MRVIRIYDDRNVFYNNINLEELCSEGLAVEYCTIQDRQPVCITVDKSFEVKEPKYNWDFTPDSEYCVFLDTRWDRNLMNQQETVADNVDMPHGLISQIKQPCVKRVIVYTLYGPTESRQLVNALMADNNLIDKVKDEPLSFSTSQPQKAILDIKQEVEQWENF